MAVDVPQHLSPTMTARLFYVCCHLQDGGTESSTLRKRAGVSGKTATVSQAFTLAEKLGLIKGTLINTRLKDFKLVKKGEKFIEENAMSVTETLEDAFVISKTTAASAPEAPRTESENAAVEGIAALIDENRRLRAALTKIKHEVEALLV